MSCLAVYVRNFIVYYKLLFYLCHFMNKEALSYISIGEYLLFSFYFAQVIGKWNGFI
jgi:hypothetical protein